MIIGALFRENVIASFLGKIPAVCIIEVIVLDAGKTGQEGLSRENNRISNISRGFGSKYTSCLESHRDSICSYA